MRLGESQEGESTQTSGKRNGLQRLREVEQEKEQRRSLDPATRRCSTTLTRVFQYSDEPKAFCGRGDIGNRYSKRCFKIWLSRGKEKKGEGRAQKHQRVLKRDYEKYWRRLNLPGIYQIVFYHQQKRGPANWLTSYNLAHLLYVALSEKIRSSSIISFSIFFSYISGRSLFRVL